MSRDPYAQEHQGVLAEEVDDETWAYLVAVIDEMAHAVRERCPASAKWVRSSVSPPSDQPEVLTEFRVHVTWET